MKKVLLYMLLAISVLAMSCSKKKKKPEPPDATGINPEKEWVMYGGTYTKVEPHVNGHGKGILIMGVDKATGQSRLVAVAPDINPSYVALSPDRKYLYCVNETGADVDSSGDVTAYRIEEGGQKLKWLGAVETGAFAPCHLSVHRSGKFLAVANYVGGVVNLYRLNADGSIGEQADKKIQVGKGPHPEQESSHPHMCKWSADGRFLFVPDKGANKVFCYELDTLAGKLTDRPAANVKAGNGPRHMTFSPDNKFAYVINENSSTVTVMAFDAAKGSLTEVQEISTMMAGINIPNHCADIRITRDGRFLYASNRGHESIAMYSVNAQNGQLTLLGHELCRGGFPRSFTLSPDDKFLIVANQNTDNVVTFRIGSDGRLGFQDGNTTKIESPVCLTFE